MLQVECLSVRMRDIYFFFFVNIYTHSGWPGVWTCQLSTHTSAHAVCLCRDRFKMHSHCYCFQERLIWYQCNKLLRIGLVPPSKSHTVHTIWQVGFSSVKYLLTEDVLLTLSFFTWKQQTTQTASGRHNVTGGTTLQLVYAANLEQRRTDFGENGRFIWVKKVTSRTQIPSSNPTCWGWIRAWTAGLAEAYSDLKDSAPETKINQRNNLIILVS